MNGGLFDRALFALDRQPARPDIDVKPFGLMAVLIKLITHDGDGDRKRADEEVEDVIAGHAYLRCESQGLTARIADQDYHGDARLRFRP